MLSKQLVFRYISNNSVLKMFLLNNFIYTKLDVQIFMTLIYPYPEFDAPNTLLNSLGVVYSVTIKIDQKTWRMWNVLNIWVAC